MPLRKGERGFINKTGIEAPVIRWWPGALWVRIGVHLSGGLEPSWRPSSLYAGLVGRIAWPLVAGRGPYVLWLRKNLKTVDPQTDRSQ